MFVSEKRSSELDVAFEPDEEALAEAMRWLRSELDWENVLARLRRRAGLLPVVSAPAKAA